jgi:archaellum biogenesis ATPase FlaH
MEFDTKVQQLFLEFMVSTPALYTRVQNIFNPDNFDKSLKVAAEFIQAHAEQYSGLPKFEQLNAVTSGNFIEVSGINDSQEEWFFENFEKFTRQQELSSAIRKSIDLLEKGEFDPVEKLIKDAVQIGLTRDLGISYHEDPRARLLKLRDSNGQQSTGWKTFDTFLFGGMSRGELHIFSAPSGGGKSLALQNLALNWAEMGLNGIYISLELSQELVAFRIDSMLTGYSSKEIFKNLDDVELKVKFAGKKQGKLKIKYMPSSSNTNAIRAYIKELKIKEQFRPDFIMVDYLGLVMPSGCKVDPSNMFMRDKYTSEELRNIAMEEDAILCTAAQINRDGIDASEFSQSQISGGLSQIFSCDSLMGIYQTKAMREAGEMQFQFLKTRNSSGVGSKLDMAYNIDSMRISDLEGGSRMGNGMTGSNVLAQIKNTNQASKSAPDMKAQLSALMNKVKS